MCRLVGIIVIEGSQRVILLILRHRHSKLRVIERDIESHFLAEDLRGGSLKVIACGPSCPVIEFSCCDVTGRFTPIRIFDVRVATSLAVLAKRSSKPVGSVRR